MPNMKFQLHLAPSPLARRWRLAIIMAATILPLSNLRGDDPAGQVADGFTVPAADWPWWRGPQRNGTASADQTPHIEFSESEQVKWKVDLPGRGHGSPTVCGDKIFVVTADEQAGSQSAICVDRDTGEIQWN